MLEPWWDENDPLHVPPPHPISMANQGFIHRSIRTPYGSPTKNAIILGDWHPGVDSQLTCCLVALFFCSSSPQRSSALTGLVRLESQPPHPLRVSKPRCGTTQDHGLCHSRRNPGNLATDPPTTHGTWDSQLSWVWCRTVSAVKGNLIWIQAKRGFLK